MHWVRDTDYDRQSLNLLTDALEILLKWAIEGYKTVKFPSSVSDIAVLNYYQQNNISKPKLV